MNHPIYEAYIADMKRLGASKPYMTEAQCLESAGIVIEEEHVPIMQVVPKKQVVKKCLTTDEPKLVIKKSVVPKPEPKPKAVKSEKPKRIKKTIEELKAAKSKRQKEYYQRSKPKSVKSQVVPRTCLLGMTQEEKAAHKAKMKRERDQRYKDAGLSPRKSTPESREHRRKYWAEYYQTIKDTPEFKAKRVQQAKNRKARKLGEVLSNN